MNTTATIQWSDREPPVTTNSRQELDERLDCIASRRSPDSPTIVEICVHQRALSLGLGSQDSFVEVQSESRMPPYLVTVGDFGADDVATFYFMGSHHTEIPCRHLIPIALARDVVREFFDTGRRSDKVEWEEI